MTGSHALRHTRLCVAGILAMQNGPMNTSMQSAMNETEEVIYTVVRDLLQKTGINPKEVTPHRPP